MKKRVKLLAISLTLAVVLAVSLGVVVSANGAGNGNSNGVHLQTRDCSDAVTELLGLTSDEIIALRQEGKSLVEIAAEQNVTEEELIAAIMAQKTAQIQAMVEEGTLTQVRADLAIQNMEQNVIRVINRTTVGPNCDGTGTAVGTGLNGTANGVCDGSGAGLGGGNASGGGSGTCNGYCGGR